MTEKKKIEAELEQIAADHGGVLSPVHIEAFARDKETALHGRFEWDDAKGAYQNRLWQARKLIATFIIIAESDNEPIRAWVSMREDRAEEDGGYRTLVSVLSDEERRGQFLLDAMRDLQTWKRKYKRLTELAPIFEAIAATKGKFKPKKSKRKGG
jgi:hypothetical protein